MTIREDQLRALHARITIKAKEGYCSDGPEDIDPFMFVEFIDGCVYAGRLVGAEDGLNPGLVAASSTYALWLEHGCTTLSSVILVLEGYARIGVTAAEAETHERGEFAKLFAEQPDSGVTEIMVTNCFEWEDDHLAASMVTHPFHYDDGGKLVWGEEMVGLDGESDGLIVDAFRRFWEVSNG